MIFGWNGLTPQSMNLTLEEIKSNIEECRKALSDACRGPAIHAWPFDIKDLEENKDEEGQE